MSQENEQSELTPRLRFPEFKDEVWRSVALGKRIAAHQERVDADTNIPVFTSSRSGLLPQGDYYGGSNVANKGEYGVVPDGGFVYRHMSDDGRFAFNRNTTGSPIAVSKEYPVFTADDVDPHFLLSLLNYSPALKRYALAQRAGGTRTRLYLSKLKKWTVALPDPAEQRKIAACLGSLDAWIAAESRRLAVLRRHKTGLMQQLFPRPGETRPRLRFPEFRDAGDWEETKLGDVFDTATGGTP